MTSVTNLDDTLVEMDIRGTSVSDVMVYFQKLSKLAHTIETDPCVVRCETSSLDQSMLHAEFSFCCAAEKIIFQLNYQFNSKYKH